MFRRAGSQTLLLQVAAEARGALALDAGTAEQLEAMHRFEAQPKSGTGRAAFLRELESKLMSLLGADGYARYRAVLRERLEHAILQPSAPASGVSPSSIP
jgi:hypothetical protein